MARRSSTTPAIPSGAAAAAPRASAPSPQRGNGAITAEPARPAAGRREPTLDEIRRRAYEIYLERRGVGGSPESDWLRAERELRNR